MKTLTLGKSGPHTSILGLGCMAMSGSYGATDDTESIATIHAALDASITLLDTGDFYGMGSNELLIREALKGRKRENAIISVKFGAMREPSNAWAGFDARPNAVKNFLSYSLKRLGVEYIDIYRPSRLDANVPIEDTIGAIADMVKAGYVRHIGLSEVGVATIKRAQAVHPICDLQIEYSIFSRSIEAEILPACKELGIAITAYGILSRGLLSGHFTADRNITPGDFRKHGPRFQAGNVTRNLELVEKLRAIAVAKNLTVAQLAIAWVMARGGNIIPLVGAKTRDRLTESLGALNATLSPADLAEIESAVPPDAVAGDRYNEQGMRTLDSERKSSS
jgi:aryl-alcohol dehydrogenase-like predicted oxidoreductase